MLRYPNELIRQAFGCPLRTVALIVGVSVGLNVMANAMTPILNGLLFLDMLGTALSAFTLGPWWGAFVGVVTNLILAFIPDKEQYFNYVIVNVLAGILWGYAGRLYLNPFTSQNSPRRVFLCLLGIGVLCGILCSITAMYTRVRFQWHLTPSLVAILPIRHATDNIMKWAVDSGYLAPDLPTYRFLPLDAITIIPDKIISTALAAFMLFYFFPRLRRQLTESAKTIHVLRAPAVIFLGAYAYPFLSITLSGNINISNISGLIIRQVIPLQVLLWSFPAILVMIFLYIPSFLTPKAVLLETSGRDDNANLKMDDVYKDLLGLVGVIYILLLTTRLPYANSQLTALMKDGIGIVSFLAIFGLLPIVTMHYFSPVGTTSTTSTSTPPQVTNPLSPTPIALEGQSEKVAKSARVRGKKQRRRQ